MYFLNPWILEVSFILGVTCSLLGEVEWFLL